MKKITIVTFYGLLFLLAPMANAEFVNSENENYIENGQNIEFRGAQEIFRQRKPQPKTKYSCCARGEDGWWFCSTSEIRDEAYIDAYYDCMFNHRYCQVTCRKH